ncbi:phage tail family protein [Staphylococcus simulans]|nr:phage tail family protein [Staphylococcus simulans]
MNELKFPVGVKPLDFLVSSISKERITEKVEGIPGQIDYGFNYSDREASMTFWLRHYHAEHDFLLLVSELNNFLDSQPFFYVAHKYLPTRVIKITVDESYQPDRILGSMYAKLEVKCNISGLPFWRTQYTTQNLQKDGYNAVVEKYGLADGVHIDFFNYTPTTNEFSIWNGGNVTIDPRNMFLNIRFLYATSNGTVTLENLTTGEKFEFYRQFSNTHLNLFGAKVMLGTTNWLRESNRKFISLAPGENKFKVSNVTHQGISFEFPFYFK